MTEKFKTLRIIHLAICAGVIVAYLIIGKPTIQNLTIKGIAAPDFIYLMIPVLAFLLSNHMFKTQLKQADAKSGLEGNMGLYQTACIIRWAILEGAAFILLFVKPGFMVFGILIIVYLLTLHPSETKAKNDLQKYR